MTNRLPPTPPGSVRRKAPPGPTAIAVLLAVLATATQAPAQAANRPGTQGTDSPYLVHVRAAAARHGVDAGIILALIQVESRGNPDAISPAGAVGLMQVLPSTAALDFGLSGNVRDKLKNPAVNVGIGTGYLARMLARYREYGAHTLSLALAAYNYGPGAVDRRLSQRRPLPPAVRRYVEAVLSLRPRYAGMADPRVALVEPHGYSWTRRLP